jgi:hypothetical protein
VFATAKPTVALGRTREPPENPRPAASVGAAERASEVPPTGSDPPEVPPTGSDPPPESGIVGVARSALRRAPSPSFGGRGEREVHAKRPPERRVLIVPEPSSLPPHAAFLEPVHERSVLRSREPAARDDAPDASIARARRPRFRRARVGRVPRDAAEARPPRTSSALSPSAGARRVAARRTRAGLWGWVVSAAVAGGGRFLFRRRTVSSALVARDARRRRRWRRLCPASVCGRPPAARSAPPRARPARPRRRRPRTRGGGRVGRVSSRRRARRARRGARGVRACARTPPSRTRCR